MEQSNTDTSFMNLHNNLLSKHGKIIHQIWFGTIPNKKQAKKDFKKLELYRESWIRNNPTWEYVCWNYERCENLIRLFYNEYSKLFNGYKYPIQKCDAFRYFILHMYGGIYCDVDYYCTTSFDTILEKYKGNIYFVESCNNVNIISDDINVSNSLMYSIPKHPYWEDVIFQELISSSIQPKYYTKHLEIMSSTGPLFLRKCFSKNKIKYKLDFFPYKYFHPSGINQTVLNINKNEIYAYHGGKGSWESKDSKYLIFLYQEYAIICLIIAVYVFFNIIIPKII